MRLGDWQLFIAILPGVTLVTDAQQSTPAPIWTEAEVAALNAHQANGQFHPYTCPGDKASCADQRDLIATRHGWVCQCGEYRQGWAHGVGNRANV